MVLVASGVALCLVGRPARLLDDPPTREYSAPRSYRGSMVVAGHSRRFGDFRGKFADRVAPVSFFRRARSLQRVGCHARALREHCFPGSV